VREREREREKIAALTQARQSAVDIIETLTNNKQLIYQVLSTLTSESSSQQQKEEGEEQHELLREDTGEQPVNSDPNRVF
jgi:hypothetical protein